jgi:hypothetical protein
LAATLATRNVGQIKQTIWAVDSWAPHDSDGAFAAESVILRTFEKDM